MTANHFEMFYTMFISICPDLLPGPQTNTPWQALYHSQNDCEFITTIGFNVETSHKILCHGFERLWNETPIPYCDIFSSSIP